MGFGCSFGLGFRGLVATVLVCTKVTYIYIYVPNLFLFFFLRFQRLNAHSKKKFRNDPFAKP